MKTATILSGVFEKVNDKWVEMPTTLTITDLLTGEVEHYRHESELKGGHITALEVMLYEAGFRREHSARAAEGKVQFFVR